MCRLERRHGARPVARKRRLGRSRVRATTDSFGNEPNHGGCSSRGQQLAQMAERRVSAGGITTHYGERAARKSNTAEVASCGGACL